MTWNQGSSKKVIHKFTKEKIKYQIGLERNSGSLHPCFYKGDHNFYNDEAISILIAKILLLTIQMFT